MRPRAIGKQYEQTVRWVTEIALGARCLRFRYERCLEAG